MKLLLEEENIKEIRLEIGFIVEMETTKSNKEVPQIFFHSSPYSQKYDLIRLTPYHWQPAFLNFMTSQKADFAKRLKDQEMRLPTDSSEQPNQI